MNEQKHPRAYSARELVELWSTLNGDGKTAVVELALQVAKYATKEVGSLSIKFERYGSTARWPKVKWRSEGHGRIKADIQSIEGLNHLLRTVSCDPFLADECILWRASLQYGHFAIGGRERRIIIVGLTSTTHYTGLVGTEQRRHLERLMSPPPPDTEAWAGEVQEPEWCATDRWLNDREQADR